MDDEKPMHPFNIGALEITVTREEILQLRDEAGRAGDDEQALLCDMALRGTKLARVACQYAIRDALARATDGPR